ncbi:hypothetical protein BsWGS_26228 [Bradybaena similaris]
MPEEGNNILKFTSHHKQMLAPTIFYGDGEALNIPVEGAAMNPAESSTRLIAKQESCSFGYVEVSCDGSSAPCVTHRGKGSAKWFLESLIRRADARVKELCIQATMIYSDRDVLDYESATHCHICEEPLGLAKVKNHDYATGVYSGAVHSKCKSNQLEKPRSELLKQLWEKMTPEDRRAFLEATECNVCKISLGKAVREVNFTVSGKYKGAAHKSCNVKSQRRLFNKLLPCHTVVHRKDDNQAFESATTCDICNKDFSVDKVRDHCHITGKYRGAAHNACNLKLRINPDTITFPVVFHNLEGYDGHLIMQALGKIKKENITCIAKNLEKYITFKVGRLQFIDSKHFLNSSLDSLTGCLSELAPLCQACEKPAGIEQLNREADGDIRSTGKCKTCAASVQKRIPWSTLKGKFRLTTSQTITSRGITSRGITSRGITSRGITSLPETERVSTERGEGASHLLLRKGVYPYEYVDSHDRFDETQLPPKEAFYSKLTREGISDSDYAHAQKVWKAFDCKTLGDYHDVYLKTDILLLADIFETFRNTSMRNYGLDPAHYFTLPGLSWDALLKKTKVELELLTDLDMHLFFERGKRGGLSMVSKRYAEANNPLVGGYDASKPKSWFMYLDANNLYGWAMCQPLPTGGFNWVERTLEEIMATPADSPLGYTVEVDLEYPEHLHESHNDYPLAPEKMSVPREWLSEYQNTLVDKLGGKFTEGEKLVPHFHPRQRYVLHYRSLQQYVSLGMKVTKIHRVVQFRQEAWMKPYIEMNTALRAAAKSDFEKDLYKLANNAVYGKTMENVRNRISVVLVHPEEDKEKLRRLIANPAFKGRDIKTFKGKLVAVHRAKREVTLNKPIYVGQAVLDLSKLCMYDFWYNHIKKLYGNKAQLCYTDTDSLLFHVETDDIYADMKKNAEWYDFSDYSKDHPNYSTENKKVPGKFKDECNGRLIAEFVGLRPKMYSILEANGVNTKKAKGVQRAVVKMDLIHELYTKSLFEIIEYRHTQRAIRSKGHQIGVYEQIKTTLSPLDTKKWIAEDGITTLAYGHWRIAQEREEIFERYITELFGL